MAPHSFGRVESRRGRKCTNAPPSKGYLAAFARRQWPFKAPNKDSSANERNGSAVCIGLFRSRHLWSGRHRERANGHSELATARLASYLTGAGVFGAELPETSRVGPQERQANDVY